MNEILLEKNTEQWAEFERFLEVLTLISIEKITISIELRVNSTFGGSGWSWINQGGIFDRAI